MYTLAYHYSLIRVDHEDLELMIHGDENSEAVAQRCSVKKMFLEISQNSQESTFAGVSFLIKLQACNFIKNETLAQVFSCEFCKISKNILFCRTPLVVASKNLIKILIHENFPQWN